MLHPFAQHGRRRQALLAVALLAVTGLALAAGWGWRRRASVQPADPPAEITFTSPYLNTRPGVRYVGTEACARCHPDIAATYARHPMYRSCARVEEAQGPENYDEGHNSFDALGLHFEARRQDGRVTHRESLPGPHGETLAAVEGEVAYVVGSGRQGRTYLVNRDGYLFESPISWYQRGQGWGLSPGYEYDFRHFSRDVPESCLFCHGNDATPVPDTLCRYRPPIMEHPAIGCERCHGPGELHVAAREGGAAVGGDIDLTIVNPTRLEPALRDSVCEQCHLQGEVRVLRRGRSLFDFRPGLPLHLFQAIFVLPPDLAKSSRSVSHAEQMKMSACYRKSGARLRCASCHDPHALPPAAQRAGYYRARCLTCHRASDCGAAPAARRQTSPADNCVACHMGKADSTNVVHAAVTDHRILRRPDARPDVPGGPGPGEVPLRNFHQEQRDPADPEAPRDLGVAMMEEAMRPALAGMRGEIARRALPLLEAAVARAPGDAEAREAQGYALRMLGRPREALAAVEAVLARRPGREVALEEAALVATDLGRTDEAVAYWQRLLAVDPWHALARGQLAALRAQRREWAAGVQDCRAALGLLPNDVATRMVLVRCYLGLGDREQARAEFDTLERLDPARRAELRAWFSQQLR